MEALKTALDFSHFPRSDRLTALAALAFLLAFPFLPFSSFALATMIQFLMYALYGMGWNTIGGYGGQVDLGKAQYVGIGAYATMILLIRYDAPFWLSMPVGLALSVAWSFCIGYPLFALRGHYFSIATIATSLVLKDVFELLPITGGAKGLSVPPTRYAAPDYVHLVFKDDASYYYVLLVFFVLGLLVINWFRQSRLGYQLRAIKDNEAVAASLGVNVRLAKIKTYALATAFVSVVGSVHAMYVKTIEPEDTMSLSISILIALMAMLGGAGSLWGPILGAAVLVPLKSYLKEWLGANLVGLDLVLYAVIIMMVSAYEPKGIWGMIERARRERARSKGPVA